MLREAGNTGADGDPLDGPHVGLADPIDDRACDLGCRLGVESRQQNREFVAPEPKGLAALPQARRHLREDAIPCLMAVPVVDLFEAVDVEQAQRDDSRFGLGFRELALETFLEVAVVAEPRQRVGERQPHRAERLVGRPLVQRDRDERACEGCKQPRRALPEHDEHERRRRHQRERDDCPADVRADQLRIAQRRTGDGDRRGDEDHVADVEDARHRRPCTPEPVAPEPSMCGSTMPASPPEMLKAPQLNTVRIAGRRSNRAISVYAVA